MAGVLVITGPRGSGKSSAVAELVRCSVALGLRVRGYFTEGRESRSFVDAASGERHPFDVPGPAVRIGRFRIAESALQAAAKTLEAPDAQLFVVDEIGRLEMAGAGLHAPLRRLFANVQVPAIAVVREELIERLEPVFGVTAVATVRMAGLGDCVPTVQRCAAFVDEQLREVLDQP